MRQIITKLSTIPGVELDFKPSLCRFNSMGIDARARLLVTLHTREAIERALPLLRSSGVPYFYLGGGSNLFFLTTKVHGIAVRLGEDFDYLHKRNGDLFAGAASSLSALLKFTISHSLTGLEFCLGIPGTVGGAILGNAGTSQVGICERLHSLTCFDHQGKQVTLSCEDFSFGYRQTGLNGYLITDAHFRLQPQKQSHINYQLESYARLRRGQPVGVRSAGCVFKNPAEFPAGWLVEHAGLKGMSIGSFQVSHRHANFIINRSARGKPEYLAFLLRHIRRKVQQLFGIQLQYEVQLIS